MKKLNFGCGKEILENYDNMDVQEGEGICKSFDFDISRYPIKENTYEEVLMKMIIEHLNKPKQALEELYRICKPNAKIIITTPYYNNKGAYTDMTHRSFFSDRSFVNFVNEVNQTNKEKRFELISLRLIPTRLGRLFPKNFRRRLSSVMAGIIKSIYVELKVLK